MSLLAIDFGGTRTRAAWYTRDLVQLQRHETASQVDDPIETVLTRIIDTARQVIPSGEAPSAIGVAAPGPLDPVRGVILHAKTLAGWSEVPLRDVLRTALGGGGDDRPTVVENDANLAALAEYHLGAGQGTNPMLYLTLSTGIGGGAIINGQLFTGWSRLGIEPGHMLFVLPNMHTRRLEEIASGTGIAQAARERVRERVRENISRTILVEYTPEQLTSEVVGAAARAGDEVALSILHHAGYYLGLGLVNLLHVFSPEAIVIGGSVSKLGDLLLDPAQAVMREKVLDSAFIPPNLIRMAQFGDDAGLLGAALLAVGATNRP